MLFQELGLCTRCRNSVEIHLTLNFVHLTLNFWSWYGDIRFATTWFACLWWKLNGSYKSLACKESDVSLLLKSEHKNDGEDKVVVIVENLMQDA
jgi:hypothetical protein